MEIEPMILLRLIGHQGLTDFFLVNIVNYVSYWVCAIKIIIKK